MSLDVYLLGPKQSVPVRDAIFIRDAGRTREITREEWDQLNPGREPVTYQVGGEDRTLFTRNITHNLGKMAMAAGIYEALWRPDEVGLTKAHDLIKPLREGLARLKGNRPAYEIHNPENGWGDYDSLVGFVEAYLNGCIEHPEAEVKASR